jgi:serine/threonine protein kinase
MALASGKRLGPYEIVAPLGAGGMGEVYKAKDTRLGRTVVIKVLPEHLAKNLEARQRFEREARAASNLNHPNICVFHDIGREDDIDFLVMEYLEGETLAARLEKGPLPFEQVRRIGMETAGALDKAHRRGLMHRDVKPGNIMLTKTGAKLLDFGLAKMTPALSPGAPTLSSPLTDAGSVVGTFQYMSPEQLEGKEADARSDIFAFGAVLYEMATGRRAFEGKSPATVIAAIMGADPPAVSTLQPAAPPALDRLVKRCLTKDPDERCQSIYDVMLGLSDLAVEPIARTRATPIWRSLSWAIAALSLIIVVAAIYFGRRPHVLQPPMELTLLAPEKTIFDSIAVSPDGGRLAFTAIDASGKTQLWVRPLDSLTAQPLSGTEGAVSPFWSPDSRFIAFFADGRLKRIEASGGPLQTLADAADPALGAFGGAWNRDGAILFPRTHADPIYRVSPEGGEGAPTTAIDTSRQEHGHQWPQFLPDGRHFIYYAWGDTAELEGMRMGSREAARVLPIRSKATYAGGPDGSGYLLFIRDQTLLAQRFDAKRLELTGEPMSVIQPVGAFTVSQNGVLVFDPSGLGANTQLTWFDRAGKRLGTVGPPSSQDEPSLSPDERHVAVTREGEVWVYELASGIGSRLTFNGGGIPIWSPDSARIVFASGSGDGTWKLYQKLSTGAGDEELLLKTASYEIWPVGWSRDGRFLLYGETGPKTRWDLCVLMNPLNPPAERKSIVFLKTEFIEDFGQFSPDGKWIAYHSTESGRDEVYVRPFRPDSVAALGAGSTPPGGKWQVSRGGGVEPRWRADGKELFYYGIDGTMMAAPVKTGDVFEAGTPQPLFWVRARGYLRYDVTADGQRFLINTPSGEGASALSVVLNWTTKLKR